VLQKGRSLIGKVGEWCVVSWHLQGCSPHLCRLSTDGLVPANKYWTYRSHVGDMGAVSLLASCQQKLGFSTLLQWFFFGREAGNKPADHSVGLRVVSGALLFRSSGFVQIYWWLHERLLYVDHVRYVWSRSIHGPSLKSVWRVSRVFPCRVYIDLNRRDSRIWVTACSSQSSHS
jgi:hypothetical protein